MPGKPVLKNSDLILLNKRHDIFYPALILILGCILLFLLIPVAAVIRLGIRQVPAAILSDEVLFPLKLSLRTTTEAAIICMVVSVAAVYAVRQISGRLQKILFTLFSIPLSLPHLVSGIALLLVYGRIGIGDWLYRTTGIDFVYTRQGIVLALVFVNLSYAVIMLYNAVSPETEQYEFTARTLGCSPVQSFMQVTIPLMLPTFFSVTVMTWARALGEFGAVIMFAGSTRMKTEILPTAIYLNMATGDLDSVLGISVIMILVSVFCTVMLQLISSIVQKQKESFYA
jgi:molybdate transport system permease protein